MQTPEQLANKLKKHIICSDDEYIRQLCTAVWMHRINYEQYLMTGEKGENNPKLNMLIIGKSGTGKTMAVKYLAKLLEMPVIIQNASNLTGEGFKGNNVSSLIPRILETAENDACLAQYSIVVFDEFDKLTMSQLFAYNSYPISNLLTFIGGSVVTYAGSNDQNTVSMDTSQMLFIFLGAFGGLEDIIKKRLSGEKCIGFGASGYDTLPEKNLLKLATKTDLHEYGLSWEILGRINLITTTNEPTKKDLQEILTKSQDSPVKKYDEFLYKKFGIHVSITNSAADRIAEKAQDSQMGARGLTQEITELLAPAIYKLGSDESIDSLTIDYDAKKTVVKYTYQGRLGMQKRGQGDSHKLSITDIHNLGSVPLSCPPERNDIWDYAAKLQKVSRNRMKLLPPGQGLAVFYILAAAICLQLLDQEEQNPTMFSLYKKINILPANGISDYNSYLGRVCNEFLGEAHKQISYEFDFISTKKIARLVLIDYCSQVKQMEQPM